MLLFKVLSNRLLYSRFALSINRGQKIFVPSYALDVIASTENGFTPPLSANCFQSADKRIQYWNCGTCRLRHVHNQVFVYKMLYITKSIKTIHKSCNERDSEMKPDKLEIFEIKHTKWDESVYMFAVLELNDIFMQLYRIALNTTADYLYVAYDENEPVHICDIEKATKRAVHIQKGYVISDIHEDTINEIQTALLEKNYLLYKDWKYYITKAGITQFANIRDSLLKKAFNDAQNPIKSWIERITFSHTNAEIFLSYCWDDSNLADDIDSLFADTEIVIKRDERNIDNWGSIRAYMDSIRTTDFIIIIISDAYLKSYNCMYEIRQVLHDKEYRKRIYPFVTNSAKSIYTLSGKIKYITYWEEKYDETKEEISKINNIEISPEIVNELRITKEISHSISEFLHVVSDMNNPSIEEFIEK